MRYSYIVFLFIVIGVQSQNIKTNYLEQNNDSITSVTNQRLLAFTFNFQNTGITESSALGKASNGKLGFNLGLQFFVYKQFFIGGFTGTSYLDITDTALVGNYSKSTVTHSYLSVGYEYPIDTNFSVSLSFTPIGNARYKNVITGTSSAKQIDRATITMYNASCSYKVSKSMALFLDYSYRIDNTRITAPLNLQNDFNKIKYHNIGLGIRIYAGRKDLVEKISSNF